MRNAKAIITASLLALSACIPDEVKWGMWEACSFDELSGQYQAVNQTFLYIILGFIILSFLGIFMDRKNGHFFLWVIITAFWVVGFWITDAEITKANMQCFGVPYFPY